MFIRLLPRRFLHCPEVLLAVTVVWLGLFYLLPVPRGLAAEDLVAALEMALDQPSKILDQSLAAIDAESGANDDSRRWLGGLPTLSISYLGSDQPLGTDETEVSLSFPMKSKLQRRSDAVLNRVDPQLDSAVQRYRKWMLSGALRDVFARYRKATASLPAAEAGTALLAQMEAQLQPRLSAGSAERFDLIALQQQRLQAESRLASLRGEIASSTRIYQGLTGLARLPDLSGDQRSLPTQPLYERHPTLELLELNQQRELAALRASSSSATPWNIALVGRELIVPNFTEHQYGVAIDMPISIGARPSTATRSSERSLRREYQVLRDNALLSMRVSWEALQAEHETLRAQQLRLAETLDSDGVTELIRQTRDSRELPIELRIQRMLALLDAQARPGVLAAQLEANAAALRQVAGLSL